MVTEYPIALAAEKIATVPATYWLNGRGSDGQRYALTYWTHQGVDRVLSSGVTLNTFFASQSITLPNNGTVTSVSEFWFRPPFTLSAIVLDGDYAIPSALTSLPTTATVGTSGTVFNAGTLYYGDSTMFEQGKLNVSWSLKPDSASTAWFCLLFARKLLFTAPSSEHCFRIDGDGNASALRVTSVSDASANGLTIVFE